MLAPILAAPTNPSGGSSGGGTGGSSPMDGGNSQELDAADPEPEASVSEIDSGPDPDVTFVWVETPPGQGTCGANTFVGSFSCSLEGRPAAPPIVGQMTLEVAASGAGETTLMVTGKLTDATGTDFFFSAMIEGSLDCTLNELEAVTTEGTSFFGEGGFVTNMIGMYDPMDLEILGDLMMVNDAQEVCRGSFQVSAPL